ncbi:hypothetical protein INT48_003147, partial [Thamnidium elegans]
MDTPEELQAKKKSRRERDKETAEGSSTGKKRSVTNETMIQKLNRIFDGIFEYYTVSIPFNTVARPKFKTRFLTKVQEILPFIREIIVKTQLFVNYYIMVNCHQTIPNDIFTPKFWYRLCLVIGCRLAPTASQERYRSVPSLVDTYNDFLSLFPTSIKPIGTDKLAISTRRNLLTKARVSSNPGSVILLFCEIINESEQLQERFNVTVSENTLQATEKLSSLGTVLLQATQTTVSAVESTISSTRDLVNFIETVVVASQSHYEDEDSKLLLTTCIRNIRGVSNVVSFKSNVNIDVILRSSTVIAANITEVTGNMNYNLVSSNLSERLSAATILDSVNSSENINNYIQSIDSSSNNTFSTMQNTLTQARDNAVSEAVILQAEACRNASERIPP